MGKGNLPDETDLMPEFHEQLTYAVADFGYCSIYIWVSAFMTIFFTDYIGVPAASISLLLLGVRFFDAVNDPIIGSIADRSKSKYGRFKPWVGFGGAIMCVLIAMLFAAQPTWSMSFKIAWMWILYIMITIASTCYGMPYNALCGIITSNAAGRAKLANARMVCSALGTNFTNLIAASMILLFSGTNRMTNTARGYFFAVLFSIVTGLPFIIWAAVKSKERVELPPQQRKNRKLPLALQLRCLFGNKYALTCVFGQFVAGFHAFGRMTVMAYYFTYYEGDFKLYSLTGVIGLFTGICGSGVLAPWIYKIFRNKGKAVGMSFGLAGILVIPIFWFSAKEVMFWVLYAMSNAFGTAASGLRYSCDGDNADYAEYKYGVRVDGFLSSFVSLSMKAGGAVGPAVLLAILDKLGYIANQAQNASVMSALNISMSFLPGGLLLLVAFVFLKFYDMDEKKHEEIIQTIRRHHQEAENELINEITE